MLIKGLILQNLWESYSHILFYFLSQITGGWTSSSWKKYCCWQNEREDRSIYASSPCTRRYEGPFKEIFLSKLNVAWCDQAIIISIITLCMSQPHFFRQKFERKTCFPWRRSSASNRSTSTRSTMYSKYNPSRCSYWGRGKFCNKKDGTASLLMTHTLCS